MWIPVIFLRLQDHCSAMPASAFAGLYYVRHRDAGEDPAC